MLWPTFNASLCKIASTLDVLGECYENNNQLESALKCFEKSLRIRLYVYQNNQNDMIKSYQSIERLIKQGCIESKTLQYARNIF